MIWLCAVLLILILVLLLIFLPVNLVVKYKENFDVKIKIFGFNFSFPYKSGKIADSNDSSNDKGKNYQSGFKSIVNLLKQKGLIGSVELFTKILSSSMDIFRQLMKKVDFKKFKLLVAVGAKNAMETSMRYGQVSAAVYPIASAINSVSTPKELVVDVYPNFLQEKIAVDFEIDVKASIFSMIPIFFKLFGDLKNYYKF